MKKILAILLVLILAAPAVAPEAGKPLLGRQINWSHPLAKGLIGCWLMNEGSGNKVYDLSGNSNHGTFGGTAPLWSTGKYGHAIYLPGTDEYIDCGDIDLDEGAAGLTVYFVARFDVLTPASDEFALARFGGGTDVWYFDHQVDNDMYFRVDTTGGNNNGNFANSISNTTDYHHIIGVYNGSNVLVYVNGVLGTKSQGALTGTTSTGAITPLRIGTDGGGNSPTAFDVSHVMMWNRALSASEIAQLYRDPFCIFERVLIWMIKSLAVPTVGGQVITVTMQ